jgi:hypothetical protein
MEVVVEAVSLLVKVREVMVAQVGVAQVEIAMELILRVQII